MGDITLESLQKQVNALQATVTELTNKLDYVAKFVGVLPSDPTPRTEQQSYVAAPTNYV